MTSLGSGACARALALRIGLALTCMFAAPGWSTAAPLPVEDFFKPDAYADMSLSPSGRRLAATIPASNGRRALAVIDVIDPSKSKLIAAYSNADITGVYWVNDGRLVYHIRDQKETLANQRDGNGLFAIDAEGKEAPRMLIEANWDLSLIHI